MSPYREAFRLAASWLLTMIVVAAAVTGICALVGLTSDPRADTIGRSAAALTVASVVIVIMVCRHRRSLRPGPDGDRDQLGLTSPSQDQWGSSRPSGTSSAESA